MSNNGQYLKEVYINPVKLKELNFDEYGTIRPTGNIKNFIIGLRPYHKSGVPVTKSEKNKNKQVISHNYGHAGIGYTILFGSVNESLTLFKRFEVDKNEEITIIGMGIIGLTTAIKLHEIGYTNILIIGENTNNIASNNSGGLIDFSLQTIFSRDQFERMNNLFLESFLEYRKICGDPNHYLHKDVIPIDYYTDLYQRTAGLDFLAEQGIIAKGENVLLKVKGNENISYKVHHFKTFNVIPETFMSSLKNKVKEYGIKTQFTKLGSLAEVKSKAIFNCTGLGARSLVNDINMYPVCGLAFELSEGNTKENNYIVRFNSIPGLENTEIDGSFYFMPRTSGFLGSTHIKNYEGNDDKYNKELMSNLAKRASFFFKGVKPKF